MKRASLLLFSFLALNVGCGGPARPVVVGSKNFTEQLILGEILAELLEARGVPVTRKLNLEGTFICHRALVSGDLDVYVEYTGTALAAILKEPVVSDPALVLEKVKAEYTKQFGLEWGPPLGFNNAFAMVMRRKHAESLGVRTISELGPHAASIRAGFGYEFLEREDGYRGLTRAYGLDFAVRPKEMTLQLIYQALSQEQVDLVGGNATDGLIDALDLVMLEDDRHFFPPYDAAPVFRPDAVARHPELQEVLEDLAGRIDEAAMRAFNRAVDSERRTPADVARRFVTSLKPPAASSP